MFGFKHVEVLKLKEYKIEAGVGRMGLVCEEGQD